MQINGPRIAVQIKLKLGHQIYISNNMVWNRFLPSMIVITSKIIFLW